jgi:hypothetical protein
MSPSRLAWFVVVAAAALSCAGSAKRETATLAAAVDQYRRADNTSKGTQAERVAAVECRDAQVCSAKAACVAALGPTMQALALKDEVTHRLADLEHKRLAPDSPEAQALPGKLDEATRLLGEGRVKMADCDKRLADLEVAYGR